MHGLLIAIEGVDGAGKRTLCQGLRTGFEALGKSVAALSFPRYGHSVAADLAAEALHGQHGDLASSVYAMAVLFALDRAGARDEIGHLLLAYDVLILDRYVASNAAYSAARLHQDASGEAAEWVRHLEYDRLRLPAPDWQVLLDVPAELAADRARHREHAESARPVTRTSATTICSGARGTCTPVWRPRTSAGHGGSSPRTSTRRRSRGRSAASEVKKPQLARVVAQFCRDLVTPWTP